MVTFSNSITAWIGPFFDCMGGCFGCFSKPTAIAVDKPSNGLKIQGCLVKKLSVSDDFWSTSTHDLETTIMSHRSVSSISTSNQTLNLCSTISGLSNNSSDFTNQGLVLWNQTRLDWLESSKPANPVNKASEPRLNWNATYDSLLATRNRFPRPIPLAEMVDFLVDVWEHDGLYD